MFYSFLRSSGAHFEDLFLVLRVVYSGFYYHTYRSVYYGRPLIFKVHILSSPIFRRFVNKSSPYSLLMKLGPVKRGRLRQSFRYLSYVESLQGTVCDRFPSFRNLFLSVLFYRNLSPRQTSFRLTCDSSISVYGRRVLLLYTTQKRDRLYWRDLNFGHSLVHGASSLF